MSEVNQLTRRERDKDRGPDERQAEGQMGARGHSKREGLVTDTERLETDTEKD